MLSKKAQQVIAEPKKKAKKVESGVDLASGPDQTVVTLVEDGKMMNMPIDHFSYSSLTQLLRNPLIFKMKYIFKVYTSKTSVSGFVGRACHEALKYYYGGNPDVVVPFDKDEARGEATAYGLNYLVTTGDGDVDYGKTGSREEMLQRYAKMMEVYWSEEPVYHNVLLCEKKVSHMMHTTYGDLLPLQGRGIPDLVVEDENGEMDIVDTKFVSTFTSYETEDYIKIVQAMMLKHLIHEETGRWARNIIFREVKGSINKDGSSQIRDYVIPGNHQPYDILFYNLYNDAVKFISNPNAIYLPNLSDMFDGEQSGFLYAQGLINADMSDVEVMHKVREVSLTSKKFVTSRTESAENKNLLPDEKIKMKLGEFGIPVEPVETIVGASFTQYRFKVSAGIRMTTFAKYRADIAKVLEAKGDVKILAPIPGTSYVGVEVANAQRTVAKMKHEDLKIGTLMLPIGQDVNGNIIWSALDEMPHLLIAGSAGSGKSVLLHALLLAITNQMKPEDLQLVLIDPKRVELVMFSDAPHMHGRKIIYDYDQSVDALINLNQVMEERYQKLEKAKCRNIGEYNKQSKSKMQYIVLVIDEFADLILRSKTEEKQVKSYSSRSNKWLVEEIKKRELNMPGFGQKMSKAEIKMLLMEVLEKHDRETGRDNVSIELLVVSLAQKARAAGIHLIVATQRPSVDVITGLIKANMPTRIALTCASVTDSMVILGEAGAEKLTGKGDMIFQSPNVGKVRLQGFAN